MTLQGISGDIRQLSVPSAEQPGPGRLQPTPQLSAPPSQNQSPPYTVNISPRAQELSKGSEEGKEASSGGAAVEGGKGATSPQECQTCKNRKYVDRSDDPTVSFQSPTSLSPGAAETAVRAHEQEHVSNEQSKADQEGRKVVSQMVTIHYGICPECGRSYVAGGTTSTVTKAETPLGVVQGAALLEAESGAFVDLMV